MVVVIRKNREGTARWKNTGSPDTSRQSHKVRVVEGGMEERPRGKENVCKIRKASKTDTVFFCFWEYLVKY